MALAGHANLFHGGGRPEGTYPKRREDMFNPEKKLGPNMSGFGSKPTYDFIPQWDKFFYDQDTPSKTASSPMTLECAKGGGTVSLSREIAIKEPEYSHFRMAGDTQDTELWRWFLANQDKIVPEFCLNLVFVPMCIESNFLYFRSCVPLPGLVVQPIEFFSETAIGDPIDMGAPIQEAVDACRTWCTRVEIPPELQWSGECNRLFGLQLVSVPEKNEDPCKEGCGLLDGMAFDFSIKCFCPWAGE